MRDSLTYQGQIYEATHAWVSEFCAVVPESYAD
jgi:hypothetical protein